MMYSFPNQPGFFRTRVLWSVLGALILSLLASGCSLKDESELELLMHEDADYRNLIEVKRQITVHIGEIRKDLKQKKQVLDEKITGMRKAYGTERDAKQVQVDALRAKMNAIRQEFKMGLAKAKETLASKERLQSQLSSALKDAEDVVGQKEKLGLSEEELTQWQAQIKNIKERLAPLSQEVVNLKAEVAIKTKKLRHL